MRVLKLINVGPALNFKKLIIMQPLYSQNTEIV